MVNPALKMRQL